MRVIKLLMEIVKETSSIVRKDDQLLSLLQTKIKKDAGHTDNFFVGQGQGVMEGSEEDHSHNGNFDPASEDGNFMMQFESDGENDMDEKEAEISFNEDDEEETLKILSNLLGASGIHDKEYIEEMKNKMSKEEIKSLVDGLKVKTENKLSDNNDLENALDNLDFGENNLPSGFETQFLDALKNSQSKFDGDKPGSSNQNDFDSDKIEEMLSGLDSNSKSKLGKTFQNFGSSFGSIGNFQSRRKRESQAKTEITPEGVAYIVDEYLQEDQSKVTKCLIQILWNKDGKYEGELCRKVSQDLGKKVRELLFMILKKELPSSFFFLDFENVMNEFISRGKQLEGVAKSLAMKFLQPITGEDLKDISKPIEQILKKSIFGNEKIDNLFNVILQFIITTESMEKISLIVRQVQKEVLIK